MLNNFFFNKGFLVITKLGFFLDFFFKNFLVSLSRFFFSSVFLFLEKFIVESLSKNFLKPNSVRIVFFKNIKNSSLVLDTFIRYLLFILLVLL